VTDRVVAVLASPSAMLPARLTAAMLEDVVDLVSDTPMVSAALAVTQGYEVEAEAVTWPGTLVVGVAAGTTVAAVLAKVLAEVLVAVPGSDVTAVAVVAADVPDLPTLLLGKLFSALAGSRGAAVAVCPAENGGLVAVAANVPFVGWLADLSVRLDDPDALARVRRTAPPAGLSVGPGWRRVRNPRDVDRLDPGLEGWEATRSYLDQAM
jgi:hypothetical protein